MQFAFLLVLLKDSLQLRIQVFAGKAAGSVHRINQLQQATEFIVRSIANHNW